MGTDMFLKVQVLKNNEWKCIDDKLTDFRNYDSYAILAGERHDLTPISDLKDLPVECLICFKNCDLKFMDQFDRRSYTYYTLEELEKYKHWNKKTLVRGFSKFIDRVPSLEEINTRPVINEDKVYSSDIVFYHEVLSYFVGYGYRVNKDKESIKLIDIICESLPKSYNIFFEHKWEEPYKNTATLLYKHIIPELYELSNKYKVNHNEIRIVIGFDD